MVISPAGRLPDYRVVQLGLGVDPVGFAAQRLRTGPAATVITDRTLLGSRVRGVLAAAGDRTRWEMKPYLRLVQQLWDDVHRSEPDGYGQYDVELQAFVEMLPAAVNPKVEHDPLLILEGQRLPPDFYRAIARLRISASVVVDPGAPVPDDGSTIAEIVTALGNAPIEHHAGNVPASAVLDLVAAVDPARRAAPAGSPGPGPKPVVHCFDSADAEVRMAVRLAAEHPGEQVGVLLPTVELINDFAQRLQEFDARFQWYHHSRSPSPRNGRMDFASAGIKLLSWASSAGLRFDHVLLPRLQYVTEHYFARNLPVLGVTAGRQLHFSYTGDGLPTALSALPLRLIDLADVDLPVEWTTGASADDDSSTDRQALSPDLGPARAVLRDDRAHPGHRQRVLTAQEEVGLALLMRGERTPLSEELPSGYRAGLPAGDERAIAFDAMVTHNLGLVRKYASTYPIAHWDFDDLIQIGVIGLIRAVEKFDGSMGLKFSTYATRWINQAIGRAMPEGLAIRIPVHMWEIVRKISAVRSQLTGLGRTPTVSEIAARAELPEDKVKLGLGILSGVRSLDEPAGDDPNVSLWDVVVSEAEESFDEIVDRRDAIERVHSALRVLGGREAEIMRLRFGVGGDEPMTLDRIGERYSVTRERIRQIESKSKSKLHDHLCGRVPPRPAETRRKPRVPRQVPSPVVARTTIDPATLPPAVAESAVDSLVRFIAEQVVLSATESLTVVLGSDRLWCGISYRGTGDSVRALLGLQDTAHAGGVTHALRGLMTGVGKLTTWISDRPAGIVLRHRRDKWAVLPASARIPAALPFGDEDAWTMISLSAPGPAFAEIDEPAARISAGLGTVLGPRIRDDNLLVAVNGNTVRATDPFLWTNPATQDLGREEISGAGCRATVNPYVLPHPDRLRNGDAAHVGDPAQWRVRQGLYLRSEGRYLLRGGWWGLPGFREEDLSSLVRIDVEIEADQQTLWGFGGPGPIRPPTALTPRLTAVASVARKRSEAVWATERRDSV